MSTAGKPHEDRERPGQLRDDGSGDRRALPGFDALAHLAAFACGAPQAHVALIEPDGQVHASAHGPQSTDGVHALCAFVAGVVGGEPLIAPDATQEARLAGAPRAAEDRAIRFFAGFPLHSPAGQKLGTLCVLDATPRTLTPAQVDALHALARQLEAQLELRRRLAGAAGEGGHPAGDEVRLGPELIGLATHDLKNPLTAILANAHFVSESTQPGLARDAAQGIVEAAEVASRMVSDLRDVTLAHVQGIAVRRSTMEVAALFHRLRRGTAVAVADRSATLVLPEQFDPPELFSDPDLLRRILENLIENALKVTRGGRVVVGYGAAPGAHAVEFSVTDEGPDVDPALEAIVFEPRLSRPAKGTPEGRGPARGLGLYFCRLAAEALGGSVGVEPNRPHGARFVVRVPVGPEAP